MNEQPALNADVAQASRFLVVRAILHFALLCFGAMAASCGGSNGVSCTAEARPAVVVEAIDDLGRILSEVDVAYRVDGGPEQRDICDRVTPCSLGYEVSGSYAIVASKPGHIPASFTVTVARDECHVITQQITVVLQRAL